MGVCKHFQIQPPAKVTKLAALIRYANRVAGKGGADAEACEKLHEALVYLTPSACNAMRKLVVAERSSMLRFSIFAQDCVCHAMTF